MTTSFIYELKKKNHLGVFSFRLFNIYKGIIRNRIVYVKEC